MNKETIEIKKEKLIQRIRECDSLLIAFSGGVDSTFLLAVAHRILGDKVLAVTASSEAHPSREKDEATAFTHERGIPHIVYESNETRLAEFISNTPDRCYHCKKYLSQALLKIANERNIRHVAHAVNMDDLKDYRPGLKAAEELGIIAPLVDAGLTKEEIRFLSREEDLPTWNKPSMACLASRIPYGEIITPEKLKMVQEAEAFLAHHGFRQYRVRHHGHVARIEIEDPDLEKIMAPEFRKKTAEKFRKIGFLHTAVDIEVYQSGRMNRALEK